MRYFAFYATKRALCCVGGQNRREKYHISLQFELVL